MRIARMVRGLLRLVRGGLVAGGLLLVVAVAAAWTGVTWRWYHQLARPGEPAAGAPGVIVMMGGGGIPSESGLMRSWKTAEAAAHFTGAVVMVAMPEEPDGRTPVEDELRLRGVDPARLVREGAGRNTREQAVAVFALLEGRGGAATQTVALVTSPEHMTRTWRSFERAGFTRLIALPAWPESLEADLRYREEELGPITLGGAVGGSLTARYKFWDNLGLLVRCAREAVALVYYRAMGWN